MKQLEKMSMESTEIYRQYRRKKTKKTYSMLGIYGLIAILCLGVIGLFGGERINKKVLIGLLVFGIFMMLANFVIAVMLIKKLSISGEPFEYVCTSAVLGKQQRVMRENGQEVKYKLSIDNKSILEGDELVIVYVPQAKQVYIERKEDWDQIGI